MSRIIGLKDLYIATLKTDVATGTPATTYDTPIKLERAISAKITPKINTESVYSDDCLEETLSSFDSIDVEIGVNQLSIESRALLQGITQHNGEIAEGSEDIAPYLALGFKSLKSNGKYMYVWLLKGKFELAEDEYDTKADKISSKTPSLKGTFGPRLSDNKYRIIADEEKAQAARITAWFTAVPAPLTADVQP